MLPCAKWEDITLGACEVKENDDALGDVKGWDEEDDDDDDEKGGNDGQKYEEKDEDDDVDDDDDDEWKI